MWRGFRICAKGACLLATGIEGRADAEEVLFVRNAQIMLKWSLYMSVSMA